MMENCTSETKQLPDGQQPIRTSTGCVYNTYGMETCKSLLEIYPWK